MRILPAKDQLTICFAHVAYRMAERFALRETGSGTSRSARSTSWCRDWATSICCCVSMFGANEFIHWPTARFHSVGSARGTDQYARDALKSAGIRLASAPGRECGSRGSACHGADPGAGATAASRRDNQARDYWRGMVSIWSQREDELAGKTLLSSGSDTSARAGGAVALLRHAG